MVEPFVSLHLFLARHRRSVLLAAAIAAIAALLLARNLQVSEDFTDMLPMSNPTIAEQVEALRHIRQAERLFIDVQTTALDPELLGNAADALHAAMRTLPGLGDIHYRVDTAALQDAYQYLLSQLPALLETHELQALESRCEPAALENRLAWLKKSMSQPQGLMFKEIAQTDPAGFSDTVASALRSLQPGAGGARIAEGRVTSPDGRHVLLSATPVFRSSDVTQSAALLEALLQVARSVEASFSAGAVRIAITGAHRSALDNATLIRLDSAKGSGIATFAVVLLMVAAYRRRWLALLGLGPTVLGALGAAVVFSLTGDPVSAVALGCGSILIGVTVDYGILVLYHADNAPPANREQLARSMARLAPALAFGALTTMAAFFVMFLSPVSGHRQLGLFGAVGVALAAFFALVLLPVFVPVGSPVAARALPLTAAMQRVMESRTRHGRAVLPLLLLLSVASAAGLARLQFDGDLARLNGVTEGTRRDEEILRETWGHALSLTSIVVSGPTLDLALQSNESVHRALRALKQQGALDTFSSVAPFLPSSQSRAARESAWQDFWTASRRANLSNALLRASASLGFRMSAFQPFLDRLASPPQPLAGLPPAGSPLRQLAAEFISEQDGRVFILSQAKAADRESYQQLRQYLLREVPDALILNKAALTFEIARVARRALPLFAALVTLLNAALLYLLLGRLELVLITLLPMAAGVFWTLGTLGWLGWPVDLANFIFVIFVIGVCGDYSLFLVLAELEPMRGFPNRAAATGAAVTLCALTTLFGVGVLVLAQHPALFSIGLTALLGIGFSLLATLFLVPQCMRALAGRNRMPRFDTLSSSAAPGTLALPDAKLHALRRKSVAALYRYHEPFVTQFVYWKLKTDPLFQAVHRAAPDTGQFLDLGCGYGLVAHWLTLLAPHRAVLGLDFDPDKIRVAQTTTLGNPRVTFQYHDILATDTYPSCDCVIVCDVLHYFPSDLKRQVLRQAFLALRPGGRFILRDAFAEPSRKHRRVAWAEKAAVFLGHNRTRHGLHFESHETHLALVRDAGFAGVQTRANSGLGSNALLVAFKGPVPSLGPASPAPPTCPGV